MIGLKLTPAVVAIAKAVIAAYDLREASFDTSRYYRDSDNIRGILVKTSYYNKRLEDCAMEASSDYASVVFIMLKTARSESLDWALAVVKAAKA
jgi:hypothetical protein